MFLNLNLNIKSNEKNVWHSIRNWIPTIQINPTTEREREKKPWCAHNNCIQCFHLIYVRFLRITDWSIFSTFWSAIDLEEEKKTNQFDNLRVSWRKIPGINKNVQPMNRTDKSEGKNIDETQFNKQIMQSKDTKMPFYI